MSWIRVSKDAKELLKELAQNHPFYGDTVLEVVDDLLREWESREHVPDEYRVIKT